MAGAIAASSCSGAYRATAMVVAAHVRTLTGFSPGVLSGKQLHELESVGVASGARRKPERYPKGIVRICNAALGVKTRFHVQLFAGEHTR